MVVPTKDDEVIVKTWHLVSDATTARTQAPYDPLKKGGGSGCSYRMSNRV